MKRLWYRFVELHHSALSSRTLQFEYGMTEPLQRACVIGFQHNHALMHSKRGGRSVQYDFHPNKTLLLLLRHTVLIKFSVARGIASSKAYGSDIMHI